MNPEKTSINVKTILENQIAAVQDRIEEKSSTLTTEEFLSLHSMLERYIHTYLSRYSNRWA